MKFNRTVYQSFSLIGQFGINMLVPIFLCSFLGNFIDEKLGTNYIMIIMFFVGAVAGGYNVFRMSKRHLRKKDTNSQYMHGTGHNNLANKKKENEKDSTK
ncbi:MAG: AtpZ/AtpI family protein [Lachnospiraceae bacterium]|nr:AtpZ/AtpI family protein [Lachnospiraceae bacterium]